MKQSNFTIQYRKQINFQKKKKIKKFNASRRLDNFMNRIMKKNNNNNIEYKTFKVFLEQNSILAHKSMR